MSALRLCLTLLLIAEHVNAHNSYQVPPTGAVRVDTYNPPPARQLEQTYGTPPPRTYTTPAPVYEAPKTYSTPQPIQEQPKVYETPPPPCPNGGKRHPSTGDCLVNECEGQNDCSPHAACHDTFESYTCACQSGYIDESPSGKPGRVCSLPQTNNCASGNQCSPDAICTDTYNGVVCKCKGGFVDLSESRGQKPGQVCQKNVKRCEPNPCPQNSTCHETYESYECICNPGFKDVDPSSPGRECEEIKKEELHEEVIETPISLVIVKSGEEATPYSTKYSSINNKPAVEIIDTYTKDLGGTIQETRYGPAYLNTTVVKISSPSSVNPKVDDGIILNTTVITAASAGPVNACALFDAVVERVQADGGYLANNQLKVGDDVQKLNPCPKALCGGKICNAAAGEVCINGQCMIDFCSDNFCPVNATCKNLPDHAECICKPGFVDLRNVSVSLRLAAGLVEDQYCLRPGDVPWCDLKLDNCPEGSTRVIPSRSKNCTCVCNEGYVDQNKENPGRVCAAAITLQPSTLPWWLMLLLALLFLLLTLCCCLWALSRLRWFRRRAVADQGSSYSDLVIPRPKVRSMDAESMGSGSSEFTIREEIERRVITDVTRTEMRTEETEEESNEHQTYSHDYKVDNEHFVR